MIEEAPEQKPLDVTQLLNGVPDIDKKPEVQEAPSPFDARGVRFAAPIGQLIEKLPLPELPKNATKKVENVTQGDAPTGSRKPAGLPINMTPTPVISKTANELERQLAIDPTSVKRECPVALCPHKKTCPGGGVCCRSGKHCCPVGYSCISRGETGDQHHPLCVKNTKRDPNDCAYEQCGRNHKCPFEGVPVCCLGGGGRACCPLGFKCVPGNPPKCGKLDVDEAKLQLEEYDELYDAARSGNLSLTQLEASPKPVRLSRELIAATNMTRASDDMEPVTTAQVKHDKRVAPTTKTQKASAEFEKKHKQAGASTPPPPKKQAAASKAQPAAKGQAKAAAIKSQPAAAAKAKGNAKPRFQSARPDSDSEAAAEDSDESEGGDNQATPQESASESAGDTGADMAAENALEDEHVPRSEDSDAMTPPTKEDTEAAEEAHRVAEANLKNDAPADISPKRKETMKEAKRAYKRTITAHGQNGLRLNDDDDNGSSLIQTSDDSDESTDDESSPSEAPAAAAAPSPLVLTDDSPADGTTTSSTEQPSLSSVFSAASSMFAHIPDAESQASLSEETKEEMKRMSDGIDLSESAGAGVNNIDDQPAEPANLKLDSAASDMAAAAAGEEEEDSDDSEGASNYAASEADESDADADPMQRFQSAQDDDDDDEEEEDDADGLSDEESLEAAAGGFSHFQFRGGRKGAGKQGGGKAKGKGKSQGKAKGKGKPKTQAKPKPKPKPKPGPASKAKAKAAAVKPPVTQEENIKQQEQRVKKRGDPKLLFQKMEEMKKKDKNQDKDAINSLLKASAKGEIKPKNASSIIEWRKKRAEAKAALEAARRQEQSEKQQYMKNQTDRILKYRSPKQILIEQVSSQVKTLEAQGKLSPAVKERIDNTTDPKKVKGLLEKLELVKKEKKQKKKTPAELKAEAEAKQKDAKEVAAVQESVQEEAKKRKDGAVYLFTESPSNATTVVPNNGNVKLTLKLKNGAYITKEGGLTIDPPNDRASGATCDNSEAFNVGEGSFTISARIRTKAKGTWKRIVTKKGKTTKGAESTIWWSLAITNNRPVFQWGDGPANRVFGSRTVNDDKWHSIVAVRNTQSQEILLYVDGKLDLKKPDSTYKTARWNWNSEGPLEIGCWRTEAPQNSAYWGEIADIQFRKRPMGEDELTSRYGDSALPIGVAKIKAKQFHKKREERRRKKMLKKQKKLEKKRKSREQLKRQLKEEDQKAIVRRIEKNKEQDRKRKPLFKRNRKRTCKKKGKKKKGCKKDKKKKNKSCKKKGKKKVCKKGKKKGGKKKAPKPKPSPKQAPKPAPKPKAAAKAKAKAAPKPKPTPKPAPKAPAKPKATPKPTPAPKITPVKK